MTDSGSKTKKRKAEPSRAAPGAVGKLVKDYAVAIGGAAFVAIVLRVFIVEAFRIPSDFMSPMLLPGDHIFVNKVAYQGFGSTPARPARGDVIVFSLSNDPTKDYIKRVIGLEGDSVEIKANKVLLNGKSVSRPEESGLPGVYDETLDSRRYRVQWAGATDESRSMTRVTVPSGQVFVLGDNRAKGQDSRSYGFLPVSNIKGRASWIWLSLDSHGVRWSRLLTKVE